MDSDPQVPLATSKAINMSGGKGMDTVTSTVTSKSKAVAGLPESAIAPGAMTAAGVASKAAVAGGSLAPPPKAGGGDALESFFNDRPGGGPPSGTVAKALPSGGGPPGTSAIAA